MEDVEKATDPWPSNDRRRAILGASLNARTLDRRADTDRKTTSGLSRESRFGFEDSIRRWRASKAAYAGFPHRSPTRRCSQVFWARAPQTRGVGHPYTFGLGQARNEGKHFIPPGRSLSAPKH